MKPLVGVISDVQHVDAYTYHSAGEEYLIALAQVADVVPVLIPALAETNHIDQWISRLDGILLTGAASMADPALYGESPIGRDYEYDRRRDSQSAALVRAARELDKPLFGICRGMQDLNVALGGSLYQAVHEKEGLADHREDPEAPLDKKYDTAHTVSVQPEGLLSSIVDRAVLDVNSLHSQGIRRLAEGLRVEAVAADGLIEAVSVESMTFGLGVQWHPEWKVAENPIQKLLFEAFGRSCRST